MARLMRAEMRWCKKCITGVKILVSWALFFGACHFVHMYTGFISLFRHKETKDKDYLSFEFVMINDLMV